jgi:hypothetical protein
MRSVCRAEGLWLFLPWTLLSVMGVTNTGIQKEGSDDPCQSKFHLVEVDSVGQLVDDVVRCTWTLCTGFLFEGLLFLNDSLSEDGAQEYAVVREGRQIESITVSWLSRGEAHNTIDWLLRGGGEDCGPVSPTLEPAEDHHCSWCA